MATSVLLLLLLAALVGALVTFENFQSEIRASNRNLQTATKRALAPSGDALSTPQLVLIVFDRESLVARTDPGHRVISFISIPGSAHLRTPDGTTVAGVVGTAGATGLVRFARSALDLQITHIAVLRPRDVARLVDAVGGIQIRDASSFGSFVPAVLDGADAQRYLARAGPSASRTRRERAVLGAIVTRLSAATSVLKLPSLARTFSASVATDLSPREVLDLALVRLNSEHSIECGLAEGSTLEQARSKAILQQFEGVKPTPQKQSRIFPADGCRAAPLSLPVPAAVSFFGKQALALFPIVPELAVVAIALDVMLLLALFGVPQALIGMAKRGRRAGRRPGRVDEAQPRSLSFTSVREMLAESVGARTVQSRRSPVAAPAEMVQVNSPRSKLRAGGSATRPTASVRPADGATEEDATATPRRMEPSLPTPQTSFPRWPVEPALHDIVDLVLQCVADAAGQPVPYIAPWPHGRTWALVLTHDVETAGGRDAIEPLRAVEEQAGYRSSWNLVPERYRVEDVLVEHLKSVGCEVGVHGLRHDGRDLESWPTLEGRLTEIQRWARRWDAAGFRSPATHRVWEWMPKLGFDYDSSYPDTDPYEPMPGGCCSWLPFFNGKTVELPITLPQDHTLFVILGRDESVWFDKVDVLRKRGGMALALTHPDYMVKADRLEAYARFLQAFRDDPTMWTPLPHEVARWWRRRAATSLVLVNGRWQASGPAEDEVAIAVATPARRSSAPPVARPGKRQAVAVARSAGR